MKKSVADKMDTSYMKDRNYKMVEGLRRENNRALRRLDEMMYSKQGVEAVKNYKVEAVSKEQRNLRKELAKIRQTTTTTWGVLPPRDGQEQIFDDGDGSSMDLIGLKPIQIQPYNKDNKKARKKQKLMKLKEEEGKKTAKNLKQFDGIFPTSSPTNTLLSGMQANEGDERASKVKSVASTTTSFRNRELTIGDMNVTEAKDLVNKRLMAASEGGGEQPETLDSPRQPPRALHPINEKKPVKPQAKVRPASNAPSEGAQWPGQEAIQEMMDQVDGEQPKPEASNKNSKSSGKTPNKEATGKAAPAKKKPAKKQSETEPESVDELKFDASKYNPDGSLRMMHTLPDFDHSLTEALRARYVRNKFKQWFERELTVGQIFSEDERFEGGNVKLYTVKAVNMPMKGKR